VTQRVLMVAFHYPPCVGSSGVHRTLKFSRYLLDHAWQPVVLTANPRAYAQRAEHQLAEIPAAVAVARAFALDSRRHLAIRGSSLRLTALPDAWSSWWLGAIPAGLRLIRRYRPAALWSTYPIATAHLIGLTLHRLTRIPWVADFRDSMTEEFSPSDPATRRAFLWIERHTVRAAARLVFTAPSTKRMYLDRYPGLPASRCLVISNGYDETDFAGLLPSTPPTPAPLRLIHAGVIYEFERDPRPFFRALARLRREGRVGAQSLRVELRGSGTDAYCARLIRELGIDDFVHVLPALPYHESLEDCMTASALLLLQGESCNHQIPAKAYEYLRLGKPILALTSATGDTAGLLTECGGSTIEDLADEEAIYRILPGFLDSLRAGTHALPEPARAGRYARHSQARDLAACLSEVAAARRDGAAVGVGDG
jgi:glycosyltransferase involved in cell wall biosynthesis